MCKEVGGLGASSAYNHFHSNPFIEAVYTSQISLKVEFLRVLDVQTETGLLNLKLKLVTSKLGI